MPNYRPQTQSPQLTSQELRGRRETPGATARLTEVKASRSPRRPRSLKERALPHPHQARVMTASRLPPATVPLNSKRSTLSLSSLLMPHRWLRRRRKMRILVFLMINRKLTRIGLLL
jgi:hypothetical protein